MSVVRMRRFMFQYSLSVRRAESAPAGFHWIPAIGRLGAGPSRIGRWFAILFDLVKHAACPIRGMPLRRSRKWLISNGLSVSSRAIQKDPSRDRSAAHWRQCREFDDTFGDHWPTELSHGRYSGVHELWHRPRAGGCRAVRPVSNGLVLLPGVDLAVDDVEAAVRESFRFQSIVSDV